MKLPVRFFLLVVLAWLGGCPVFAAEALLNRTDFFSVPASTTRIFIDPDQWQREEIARISSGGGKPTAWLNISCVEPDRLFSRSLDKKRLVPSTPLQPRPPGLVYFYDQAWKGLLRRRIRELGQKGFSGLLLTGLDVGPLISNHPVLETEMKKLVKLVADEFKRIVPHGAVFLYQPPPFLAKPSAVVDGIIQERVFFNERGRPTRSWEQEQWLQRFEPWLQAGKIVIIAEDLRRAEDIGLFTKALARHSLDGMMTSLPLRIGRMKPYGAD
jgi:endo-alpha-1,4-polygalactosaminidase (GH114 family)